MAYINEDGIKVVLGNVKEYVDTKESSLKTSITQNESMTSIKYEELVKLRDNKTLVPGKQYRITDYITTTTQADTQSAGHQFDVIVTADDESTLNEVARACLHEGDTYFSENGANLEAWQIWYCLDNDTDRFAWADEENGKGVIYRMIDEWNNDCPYDFKNIQFLRGLYFDGAGIANIVPDGEEDKTAYCYTFGWENEDGTMLDTTIFGNNGVLPDGGAESGVYRNIIKEYIWGINSSTLQLHLNNIVFLSTYVYDGGYCYGHHSNSFENNCRNNSFGNECHGNSFGNSCSGNSFENNCINNSFGNGCSDNSFGYSCSHNSFGNLYQRNSFGYSCSHNSFGNGCSDNSFENGCSDNSFGNDCWSNSFENHCHTNSFENNCHRNSFGNRCYYNSFGNDCGYNSFEREYYFNSFGNNCSHNSFGYGCSDNSFGNSCSHNSFGNNCSNNSFGNGCYSNFLVSYANYCHFDDGCQYINLTTQQSVSSNNRLQNININRGVKGKLDINIDTLNSENEINVNNVNGYIYILEGPENIYKTTYDNLVNLRNSNRLIPGLQYRIIDYITTTSQENTQSAGHQFDIIVTAIDSYTLSEDAKAVYDEDDGYFDDSNLNAWELKYSLDNDTNRFAWAGDSITINEQVERIIYDSSACTINSELINGNEFITPFNFESCVWVDGDGDGIAYGGDVNESNHDLGELVYEWGYFTDDNNNTQLCLYKSEAELYEEEGQPDYGDKYLYRGVTTIGGEEYDYWQKWDAGDNSDNGIYISGSGDFVFATTPRIVSNPDAYSHESYTEIIETTVELNPKGVIYYMKDEWNNECPYDFKNIMFYRESLRGNIDIPGFKNDEYYYTFTWINDDGYITDMTRRQYLTNDEGFCTGVFDNKINNCSSYALYLDGKTESFLLALSKNVFISTYNYENGTFYGCYGNILGTNCYNNTFGNNCNSNTFGNDCRYNMFGNDCYGNTFGNECYYNTFGNYCYNNTFGNECYYNTFGNECYYNTFGNDCDSNTFGNNCSRNTFGNDCDSNTFGNECYSNTFGDNCSNNTFGKYCTNNTFGNSYGTGGHYYRYFTLGDGTQYIIFKNTGTASDNNWVQNYKTSQGLQGTDSNKLTVEVTRGLSYENKIARNSAGEIKVYCEADLIA